MVTDTAKRRIRIGYTCSDYVRHHHRWWWTAYLCGRCQYVFALLFGDKVKQEQKR